MGKAISKSIRQQIVKEHALGKSCRELSTIYKVSYKSVLRFCKSFQLNGDSGLKNNYSNCGSASVQFAYIIYRSICWLKYLHPEWGAAYILLQMERRHGITYRLPNERTAQFWFKAKGYNKSRLRNEPPKFAVQKATFVHSFWQIDAKEKVKLANGDFVCWLTITDEFSCAILEAPVFPPKTNLPIKYN